MSFEILCAAVWSPTNSHSSKESDHRIDRRSHGITETQVASVLLNLFVVSDNLDYCVMNSKSEGENSANSDDIS